MLIDDQMPQWEQRFIRAEPVEAIPAVTYDAIRRIDFLESPMIGVPNRVRLLPEDVVRWARRQPAVEHPDRFGFDQLLTSGFQIIAEEPGYELVLGFIGRWWQRDFGPVDWSPAEFRGFDRPNYGVGAWGFTALPYGDRATVLVTEVRMRCTDEEARRAFRRYYAVTGPFIKAMAGPVLTLVHKEAERAASASAS